MKEISMHIHFGFAGFQGSQADFFAYQKIESLIEEFLQYAKQYNSAEYGFTGAPICVNLFSGDLYITDGMRKLAARMNIPLTMVKSADDPPLSPDAADYVIALDVNRTNLSYPNITAEYVVNHSDVVFLLWDGIQDYHEGTLWTMLQLCKQKHIPYYLINTASLDDVLFSSDSYYVPYAPEFIQTYAKNLYGHKVSQEPTEKIPFFRLWRSFYSRFMRPHKRNEKELPPDTMLTEHYFPEDHPCAENHTTLYQYYDYYNKKANDLSDQYRSSIYFRSILPFWALFAIAVGTYSERIGLAFFNSHAKLWTFFAALGFLMHAFFNGYAYLMEKNKHVQQLRTDFISSRFIAEYLRILIHGEPYAIQLDNVCMDTPLIDKHILAKLHHILRMQKQVSYTQTTADMDKAVVTFKEFIDNQTTYHKNCIQRYRRVSESLAVWSENLLRISLAVVVGTFLLQFAIYSAKSFVDWNIPWVLLKDMQTFLINFPEWLNVLIDAASLLIPAWASYFTTKLAMNNFKWLHDNSEDMINGYAHILKKLEEIQRRENNSCQIMNDISNDIMNLSQNDFTNWYLRTGAQMFTRL